MRVCCHALVGDLRRNFDGTKANARSSFSSCSAFIGLAASAHAAPCTFEAQGEGRVAAVIDARTFRLAGWPRSSPRRHRAGDGNQYKPQAQPYPRSFSGHDVTLRGQDDTPTVMAASRPLCSRWLGHTGAEPVAGAGRGADLGRCGRQGVRRQHQRRRSGGENSQTRNLGRSRGHKKHGKSGRYFGWDRALYGGRGQGFIGPAGRGNDLPEFRTELDTGLCCDYFKAHAGGIRGRGHRPKSLENRRIRVRGWVEARGGPRIEVLRVGQIELVGGN